MRLEGGKGRPVAAGMRSGEADGAGLGEARARLGGGCASPLRVSTAGEAPAEAPLRDACSALKAASRPGFKAVRIGEGAI